MPSHESNLKQEIIPSMLTSRGKCICSRGGHSFCFSRNCDVMCSDKFLTKIGVQCTLQGYACLLCEKIPIPVFLGCEKVPNFCLLVMWESIKNLSFLWCEKVPNSCLLVMWESTKFLSSCDVRKYLLGALFADSYKSVSTVKISVGWLLN